MSAPTPVTVFRVYDNDGEREPRLCSTQATVRDERFVVAPMSLGDFRTIFDFDEVGLSAEAAVGMYVAERQRDVATLRRLATVQVVRAEAARKLVSP